MSLLDEIIDVLIELYEDTFKKKKKKVIKRRKLTTEEEEERQIRKSEQMEQIIADSYDDRYNVQDMMLNEEHQRLAKYKIKFDFIPEKQQWRNVRSASFFKYGDYLAWSEIRDLIEEKSNGFCEVCGSNNHIRNNTKDGAKTECHEVWSYKEIKGKGTFERVQTLEKLSPRCSYCHKISHINQVFDNALKNKMMSDYCAFNKVSLEQAKKDLDWALEQKKKHDNNEYKLDMKLINKLKVSCRFDDGLFDCHTPDFNKFLGTDFIDDGT